MSQENVDASDKDGPLPPLSNMHTMRKSVVPLSDEELKARCLKDLDPARALDDRISIVYELCQEAQHHSSETVKTLLTAAEDLTTENAPLNARRSGFVLIEACTSRLNDLEDRYRLFSLVISRIASSEVSLQISALNTLTTGGLDLAPFEVELVVFLNSLLYESFSAATQAREEAAGANSVTYKSIQEKPSSSRSSDNQQGRSKNMLGEVKSLRDIFYFVASVITHNRDSFRETNLEVLMERLASIARKTTSKKDMHGVVKILHAITAHTQVSSSSLELCILTLCSIFGLSNIKFEEELWACFSNLLQSQNKKPTIEFLVNVLSKGTAGLKLNGSATIVRGSLLTLGQISDGHGMGPLLIDHVQQLLKGLSEVFSNYSDLQVDVVHTANALLFNQDIVRFLPKVDWGFLSEKLDGMDEAPQQHDTAIGSDEYSSNTEASQIYRCFVIARGRRHQAKDDMNVALHRMSERIAFCVSSYWHDLTQSRVKVLAGFLVIIAVQVPSTWEHAARFMWSRDLLRPSEDGWALNLGLVLENILVDSTKPQSSRLLILSICTELLSEVRLDNTKRLVIEGCLDNACQILSHERDLPASIIESLANLLDVFGSILSENTFDRLLAVIENALEMSSSDSTASAGLSDLATDSLNRLFVNCILQSAPTASKVYSLLLLAAAPTKPTRIRLKAMDVLIRLRSDSEQATELVSHPDSHGLAKPFHHVEDANLLSESLRTSSNRISLHEQPLRQGRSSVIDMARVVRSRSATRSSNVRDGILSQVSSFETYSEWFKGLPEHWRGGPSQVSYLRQSRGENTIMIDISPWLDLAIDILERGSDWEIYVYILVHLPSQLSNRSLFAQHVRQLQTLHNILTTQLEKNSFHKPQQHSGISTGDVALYLYHILTVLVSYNQVFSRRELDSAVRIFSTGINKWDRVGKCCIHALALCCHEIPSVIDRHIFAIIQKMSQKITQADLAVDILEFLLGLAKLHDACASATARLPDAHSNGQGDDGSFFKTVFGICTKYIKSAREQRQEHAGATSERSSQRKNRQSGMSAKATHTLESNNSLDVIEDLSEYVYTLAYHVITFWFLSIDVRQRSQHVGWIAKELAWQGKSGQELSDVETLDEHSQVILDMMHRTAYSDLGETEPAPAFKDPEHKAIKKTWLLGMSIITLEILPTIHTGQLTKRQASGTTHALYSHTTATLPEHHVRESDTTSEPLARELIDVYPNHMLLQLASTIAPVPIPLQPVVLPDDDFTQRVLRNFDRIDTVDGHKAGIIYIREGQRIEAEILANAYGTESYEAFLSGLGTSVELKGAIFNTQGLDRQSDADGTHTYAWRDRVTEIVFHVTTMMPTDIENDPHSDNKKRHIGNDRVKIIFNDSGLPFDFDTFPSAFNEVNIVVSPEAHTASASSSTANVSGYDYYTNEANTSLSDRFGYYKVHMLCSPGFPHLSPASSPKIISAEALPGFVRQLALNASVFCQVWSEVLGQGKYVSSWRARLQEIKRLREKYSNTHESANVSYPMPTNASTYVEGDEWKGRVAMGGIAEMNQLLMSLDFTRWT